MLHVNISLSSPSRRPVAFVLGRVLERCGCEPQSLTIRRIFLAAIVDLSMLFSSAPEFNYLFLIFLAVIV